MSCLKFCKANCIREYFPVKGIGLFGDRVPSSLTVLKGEFSWKLLVLIFVIISSRSIAGDRALAGEEASLVAFCWTYKKTTLMVIKIIIYVIQTIWIYMWHQKIKKYLTSENCLNSWQLLSKILGWIKYTTNK